MKKEWLLIPGLLLALFLYSKAKNHKSGQLREIDPQENSAPPVKNSDPQLGVSSAKSTPEPKSNSAKPEIQSLGKMSHLVSAFSSGKKSLNELVEQLKSENQQPYFSKDKNAFTGELTIVRTKNPFPGTRYFHAQYFSDDNGEPQLQHMSFEFKPGPTAMQDAVSSIYSNFPGIGKPVIEKPDFVQWKMPNGFILWAKKMSLDDLKDNPFNAYTPNDVGTIWVSLEADIHE